MPKRFSVRIDAVDDSDLFCNLVGANVLDRKTTVRQRVQLSLPTGFRLWRCTRVSAFREYGESQAETFLGIDVNLDYVQVRVKRLIGCEHLDGRPHQ